MEECFYQFSQALGLRAIKGLASCGFLLYFLGLQSRHMGNPSAPEYTGYSYMDPLGFKLLEHETASPWRVSCSKCRCFSVAAEEAQDNLSRSYVDHCLALAVIKHKSNSQPRLPPTASLTIFAASKGSESRYQYAAIAGLTQQTAGLTDVATPTTTPSTTPASQGGFGS